MQWREPGSELGEPGLHPPGNVIQGLTKLIPPFLVNRLGLCQTHANVVEGLSIVVKRTDLLLVADRLTVRIRGAKESRESESPCQDKGNPRIARGSLTGSVLPPQEAAWKLSIQFFPGEHGIATSLPYSENLGMIPEPQRNDGGYYL